MGKVKEVFMDIKTEAWSILEQNPSETFETLVAQVETNVPRAPKGWVRDLVTEVWEEYKEHGFNGDDRELYYQ